MSSHEKKLSYDDIKDLRREIISELINADDDYCSFYSHMLNAIEKLEILMGRERIVEALKRILNGLAFNQNDFSKKIHELMSYV